MLLNEQDFIISARNFLLPTGNYEALGNASRWYVFKGFTADIIDWWENPISNLPPVTKKF